MKKLLIGTSGFQFEDWVGPVYPPDLPRGARLTYYRENLGFEALELNYTYYRLPSPRTSSGLLKNAGDNLIFVVRSHREMTHEIFNNCHGGWAVENARQFQSLLAGTNSIKSV